MSNPQNFNPPIGVAQNLAPGLQRILAPNPSPLTFRGTNSYLIGRERLIVLDPGPDSPAHLAALQKAIANRPVDLIVVTHSHVDHSALAPALSATSGAKIAAFGNSTAGRSKVMTQMINQGFTGGGEGIDTGFAPDLILMDGAEIQTDMAPLKIIHTPGHMGNHICLSWQSALFSGDHVMGWASSLVSPPDGDLSDFMISCRRLLSLNAKTLYPGHGAEVTNPNACINALIHHRQSREAQVLAALTTPQTPESLTQAIYTDTPALLPAAQRNVLAHLIDLTGRHLVRPIGPLFATTRFERI